jgi:hypothetical protein
LNIELYENSNVLSLCGASVVWDVVPGDVLADYTAWDLHMDYT